MNRYFIYVGELKKPVEKGVAHFPFFGFFIGQKISGIKVELNGQQLEPLQEYILYLHHQKIVDTLMVCSLVKYRKL